MTFKLKEYIKQIATSEGFKNIQVIETTLKNKETSALCNRQAQIIYLNTLFPIDWTAKDIWKLCLHEIAHLFPTTKEIDLNDLIYIEKRCTKEGCSDPTDHLPSFWKNFDRLKRKYSYWDFLRKMVLSHGGKIKND